MQPTSTRYKLFLLALTPLAIAHVTYRSLKDGGWRYFRQRLGFGLKNSSSRPIHFHCASVGEFITAKPLIQEVQKRFTVNKIIITTNTPTAASLVNKLNDKNISHCYLPLDLTFSTKRFFQIIKPLCSFILETEIWPTFYYVAASSHIPITIINARLSNKTSEASTLIQKEYASALKNVDLILARSSDDQDKYVALGAAPDITRAVGNLKYSISNTNNSHLACTTIKRPFFLAASTHEDEELQISQHLELLKRKNYLLVLAPRYPERCKQLAHIFREQGFNVATRSVKNEVADNADIYIVDTLGELNMFFNEAALVFVGGSLIPRGGHNILEPANYGKCIIVGPHTENFILETRELNQKDALIQVSDNHDLGVKLIPLLKNDKQREKYGKNAEIFMNEKSQILGTYINHVNDVIRNQSG